MFWFNGGPLCYIGDTNNLLSLNVLGFFFVLRFHFMLVNLSDLELKVTVLI